MKKKLTLLVIMFLTIMSFAQNGINYKAVIKDNLGNVVANDLIQIQFNVLEGVAQTNVYSETHSPTTDNNGIIMVNIGEGALVSGSQAFNSIDWSNDSHFLQVLINIGGGLTNMGTTEFKTVPYALTSGDKTWEKGAGLVYLETQNVGIGTATPTERLEIAHSSSSGIKLAVPIFNGTTKVEFENGNVTGAHSFFKIHNYNDRLSFDIDTDLSTTAGYENKMTLSNTGVALQNGTRINEFSTDGALSGASDAAVPTEKAVKTYIDSKTPAPVIFKVRGNGFAVLEVVQNTTVELNIWDTEIYDTANSFNTTTKRFVAPSAGYYFFHAYVRHSNNITTNTVRLSFNIDTSLNFATTRTGVTSNTEISGIYYVSAGQEVYLNLRNYNAGLIRPDGYSSWFEGYKLN